jgi:hypothetical protein
MVGEGKGERERDDDNDSTRRWLMESLCTRPEVITLDKG